MKNKLPTIEELTALVANVKAQIEDCFRAFEDDEAPGIQLTVGCGDCGNWDYQTGDNSFHGGAYGFPHWAVVGIYRDTNCREEARFIQEQLAESQDETRAILESREDYCEASGCAWEDSH